MGRGLGACGPKIIGLLEAHEKHPEGVEASLIERGLRWRDVGSRRFTWEDAHAVISTLPWDSPLARQSVEGWEWGNPIHQLLAIIAEATHNGNIWVGRWNSKVKDSDLLRIQRPGDVDHSVTTLGSDPVPLDEMIEFLGDGWQDVL